MASQFSRGNVVKLRNNVSMPILPGTILMVRAVFIKSETKEDSRRFFCHLTVDDNTPIYYCVDSRGESYFVPEYYEEIPTVKEGDTPTPVNTPTLEMATPQDELNMILLDEIRQVKSILLHNSGSNHRHGNSPHHGPHSHKPRAPRENKEKTEKEGGFLKRLTRW